MILGQAPFAPPVSSDAVAFTLIPLFALAAISVLGLPVLLIAKWGRWRLLFAALTPLTLASVVTTFIATLMHDRFAVASAPLPTGLDIGCYLGVSLSIGLLILFAIVTLFALADKRRWGVIACLVGAPIVLLALLLGVRVSNSQPEPNRSRPAMVARQPRVMLLTDPVAAIASDTELLTVAAPEPSIPLDDEEQSEEPTPEERQLEEPSGDGDKIPDWVTADAKPHDRVFSAGPFVTISQCEADINRQMLAWLCKKGDVAPPEVLPPDGEELLENLKRATHLGRRQTSVGLVYFKHTRAHSSPDAIDQLRSIVTAEANQARGTRGFVLVAMSGCAILGAVGLLHLTLRGGETPAADGGA